jgi:dUTP pyrophosphatase
MFVYLAQPIDQAKGAQHNVGGVTSLLRAVGINWYRPAGAFGLHGDTTREELLIVDRINREAIELADAVVAWLPPKVPTLGTPSEIEFALAANKPTLILTDVSLMNVSVQLAQWAKRGAIVMHWSDSLARRWEADPMAIRQVLSQSPVSRETRTSGGFYDEAEAVARSAANRAHDLPVLLEEGATLPSRAHGDDAGLDLAILRAETLEPGECRMLPTGVRAALPHGTWGLIIGRSSTWVKHGVDVRLAVIDAGYRGELMIQAHNQNHAPVSFKPGTRLAQYVILPTWLGTVLGASGLPEHARGENGYGSSGE